MQYRSAIFNLNNLLQGSYLDDLQTYFDEKWFRVQDSDRNILPFQSVMVLGYNFFHDTDYNLENTI